MISVMRKIDPTMWVWTFAPFTALISMRKLPLRVWYFHTQALWSFIVVFDSAGIVRFHVALPQRQLSKGLLSQLWVTQTASGTQKGSAVLMIPGAFAIQMRSVLQTDAKWKEWRVFSLESSLCLTAHTMLLGRKSQKMSCMSKWKAGALLTWRIKSQ